MGWFDAFNPGKLASGVGNMFDSFLHPERGYEEAEKHARKGYEESLGYQKPFYEHGLESYGPLKDAYAKLLHPEQLQEEWSKSYSTSPEAQRLQDTLRQQGMEEASRMGLMGSSGALANVQQGVGNIAATDRRAYLNDMMQKYMQGIGLGQNIYGIGADMGKGMGQNAMRHGENMAGLGYGRMNAPGEMFGGLLGMGGGLLSKFLTGGAG